MIQPLRTAHRRVFLALAFALPIVLLIGLGARRQLSSNPAELSASFHLVKSRADFWKKHGLQTAFYINSDSPPQIYLSITELELPEPDLLLYWSHEDGANSLSAGAQLLGAIAPGRPFPLDSSLKSGYLVLYSLAHQQVVDVANLEKMP
jgi:hypothetical protein